MRKSNSFISSCIVLAMLFVGSSGVKGQDLSSCLSNAGTPNPWPYPTPTAGTYIPLGDLGKPTRFSVSVWVRPEISSDGHLILLDCSHGGSANWVIQSLDYGANWVFLGTTFALQPGVWQHLLCTHDNGVSKVYVNGTLVTQANWTMQWGASQNVYLGNWPEGGRRFKGQVDELMITRNILYSTSFVPPSRVNDADIPLNSLGLWHFDEAAGTTTANAVGGGTTTINGWTWSTRATSCTLISQPLSIAAQDGQYVTFAVAANTSSATTYQWQRKVGSSFVDVSNTGKISGSASSKLIIESAQSSVAGVYRCIVSSAGCALTSNEATLTVNCNCGSN